MVTTHRGQFRAIDWLDTDTVADSLTAPALKTLLLSGAMQADIHLTGEGVSGQILKSAEIKGQVSGDWLIQGRAGTLNMGSTSRDWSAAFSGTVAALKTKGDLNGFLATPALQWLKVGGNLNQTEVIVGADLGADGLVGGTDAHADHYTPGVLTKLQINGDVANSLIRVGVDPVDGQFDNGNDVLLGAAQSRIKELSVAGHLSGTTRIIAGAFPAKVRVNGKRVSPASVAALSQRVIDHQAPTLTASLANDTGVSNSDGITKDPTVQGMVADALGPLKLFAVLDPASSETVLTDLSSLTVGLAISSDTGTVGDGMTAAARVNITGHAEAGSTVVLGNITTLVGAGGVFQLTDVALVEGNNTLNLSITDSVGNVGQTVLNITRQGTISTDVALTWNQQALEAIREDVLDPTIATRVLALVSLAQYDTLASIEGTPAFLVHYAVEGQINTDIALAKAAQTVLSELFPARRNIFDTALAQTLGDVSDGAAKSNALLLGQNIGQSVMALREHDGSDAFIDYNGSNEVGQWRTTAPMYLVAEDPQWVAMLSLT